MTAFHQINVSRSSNISLALIEQLTNGKPLSLYVDGIVSRIKAEGKSSKIKSLTKLRSALESLVDCFVWEWQRIQAQFGFLVPTFRSGSTKILKWISVIKFNTFSYFYVKFQVLPSNLPKVCERKNLSVFGWIFNNLIVCSKIHRMGQSIQLQCLLFDLRLREKSE